MVEASIHEDIGALKADVRGLQRSIDALNNTIANLNMVWGQREQSASDGRRVLHDKMDGLDKNFTLVSAEVENVSRDLTEIKPAIQEFKNQRQQQIGAQRYGKKWLAGITTAAGLSGFGIHELISWIRHP